MTGILCRCAHPGPEAAEMKTGRGNLDRRGLFEMLSDVLRRPAK